MHDVKIQKDNEDIFEDFCKYPHLNKYNIGLLKKLDPVEIIPKCYKPLKNNTELSEHILNYYKTLPNQVRQTLALALAPPYKIIDFFKNEPIQPKTATNLLRQLAINYEKVREILTNQGITPKNRALALRIQKNINTALILINHGAEIELLIQEEKKKSSNNEKSFIEFFEDIQAIENGIPPQILHIFESATTNL
jgi:hypothetical protein